jgi:heat shock protein HspQ
MSNAAFAIGQLVHHRLFNYRGVVIDVDPCFMLSEEWYRDMANSCPPKDKPWYRVLVHNAIHETYVAERNLEPDESGDAIKHPDLPLYFTRFYDGHYQLEKKGN